MLPVSYVNTFSRQTITRPANTTAYALGQAIAATSPAALVFPATVNRRGGYITRVLLTTNKSNHTEALRLHLFDTLPTALADQATFTLAGGTESTYEGYVDFTTFVSVGNYAVSEGLLVARPLQFESGANNEVSALLEARAAFTPNSGQTFAVNLYTEYSS